jgi:hypothetical protein
MLLNGSDRFAIFNRERGNPQSRENVTLHGGKTDNEPLLRSDKELLVWSRNEGKACSFL